MDLLAKELRNGREEWGIEQQFLSLYYLFISHNWKVETIHLHTCYATYTIFLCFPDVDIRTANVFSLRVWTTNCVGQFYEEGPLLVSPRLGAMVSNAWSKELLRWCREKNAVWDFWVSAHLDRRAALLSGEFSWPKADIYVAHICRHKLPRLPLVTVQQRSIPGSVSSKPDSSKKSGELWLKRHIAYWKY